MAPVDQLTQPAALPAPAYSASQSYVAIITSDGDNMQVRLQCHVLIVKLRCVL